MGKKWFSKAIIALGLLALIGITGCSKMPSVQAFSQEDEKSTRLEEVYRLRREIQLLNLLNGLELNPEQMRFILKKAEEAQALREEYLQKAEGRADETSAVFSELRDTLMQGENISDSLKGKVYEVEGKNKELKKEYEEKILALAKEVESILEEHQLYALEEFVPCLIPPQKGLRIGQARDSTRGEQLLVRLRQLSPGRFERIKERLAERILEGVKKHLPPGYNIDEEREKERILSLLEEAYSLSDVDFNLEKTEILQELWAPYELPEKPVDVTVKIKNNLLDPRIIPLLEEKLSLVEGTEASE